MPPPEQLRIDVIAMHGWAGQSTNWDPWLAAMEPRGWQWQSPERGYGRLTPTSARWGDGQRRVVIGHSLGPHLLPASVLAHADVVVLLASFARFLPPDPQGWRWRNALEGMAAQLVDCPGSPSPPSSQGAGMEADPGPQDAAAAARAQAMLHGFLAEAAAPDPVSLMPPGPADLPLGACGRRRLLSDLNLLRQTTGLPAGFPRTAKILIVEAERDRIVPAQSKAALRQALPSAQVITMADAGHALLRAPVIPVVLEWLGRSLQQQA